MNPNIFREYDIRGVADHDMPSDFVRDLGRALGTFLRRTQRKRIALGRDCRESSPRLHEALRDGLMDAGMHLVDIGVVPTPMMYFSVFHLDLDGGVQITGSHNPPLENGFKMMQGKHSLYGDDVRRLRGMVEAKDFDLRGAGRLEEHNLMSAYAGFMRGNLRFGRANLRFAVDAGNGAGGPTAITAMKALKLDPIALLCEMDGAFPNHHPDPTELKNLELLKDTIKQKNLEFGIAYDGDADRIGVMDGKGDVIWGDKLMILFARSILKLRPGAAILGEVKCSQTLYDDIAKHGGRPILWKTGHSLIKAKMKEEKALLAGEMSGHMFFADRYYGYDDAIYASLRLIEILSNTSRSLHELLADIPNTHSTPEIRIDCADDKKFKVVDQALAHYRKTHKVVDVDGARIQFEGGWGLVRASNTQPCLVLRFEADTEERLASIRKDVEGLLAGLEN